MFFIDVTPDGRFRYAGFNPAEEEALGLSTEQVAGKFVEDVFPQDLAQKLTRNYRLCVEAGKPITYDDELNLPAGRRHFHSNLIPLTDSAGRIHRIVGACIDTTDLKRTQEEALSRQKLESLGVLAAGIAHDFNNLLGSILAEAELAEVELATGEVPGTRDPGDPECRDPRRRDRSRANDLRGTGLNNARADGSLAARAKKCWSF